jgi:hypothetical protein
VQLPVLLGLAALWAAVLLPDFLRRRTTRRSSDSISSFSRHLSVLERSHQRSTGMGNVVRFGPRPAPRLSNPVAPLVARKGSTPVRQSAPVAQRAAQAPRPQARPGQNGRSAGQQRRQDVIVALLAASLLSFLATLTFSGLFLYLHLAIDLALVAYVGAVLTLTRRNQARSAQVTYLSQRAPMSSMVPVAAQQQRRSAAR